MRTDLVYWGGIIAKKKRQRFHVLHADEGVYDLIISRVDASDAGIYRCLENDGRYPGEACTELIVLGETVLSRWSRKFCNKSR